MDAVIGFLFFVLIFGVITGLIGRWIAAQKGRSGGEGFLLGFFLSVIGLIIEALLPTIAARRVSEPDIRVPGTFATKRIKWGFIIIGAVAVVLVFVLGPLQWLIWTPPKPEWDHSTEYHSHNGRPYDQFVLYGVTLSSGSTSLNKYKWPFLEVICDDGELQDAFFVLRCRLNYRILHLDPAPVSAQLRMLSQKDGESVSGGRFGYLYSDGMTNVRLYASVLGDSFSESFFAAHSWTYTFPDDGVVVRFSLPRDSSQIGKACFSK